MGLRQSFKGVNRAPHFNHVYGIYNNEFKLKEQIFLKLLESARDRCVSNGCEFLVALHPINFMVDEKFVEVIIPENEFDGLKPVYYDHLEQILSEKQFNVVNIHSEMDESNLSFFPENGEVHYNLNGNRFAGDLLASFILNNGWLENKR